MEFFSNIKVGMININREVSWLEGGRGSLRGSEEARGSISKGSVLTMLKYVPAALYLIEHRISTFDHS